MGSSRIALVLGLVASFATAAHASNGVIVLTVAGEAYKGAPKFRLMADERIVGTGEASKALDTSKGQRLNLTSANKHTFAERFSFDVPDIDSVSHFDIEFINDACAGKGKPGDRNLYVLALSVRLATQSDLDTVVTMHEFLPRTFRAMTPEAAEISSQYAALKSPGRLRLVKPDSGWGSLLGEPQTMAATPKEATASKETLKGCDIAPFELARFEKNTAELSQVMREQLAGLSKTLADKPCGVKVTAYTGGGPSDAFRTVLSGARAQAVAKELVGKGIANNRIRLESAQGLGRRVVISFQ